MGRKREEGRKQHDSSGPRITHTKKEERQFQERLLLGDRALTGERALAGDRALLALFVGEREAPPRGRVSLRGEEAKPTHTHTHTHTQRQSQWCEEKENEKLNHLHSFLGMSL